MASIQYFSVRKSALFYLVLFLFASLLVSTLSQSQPQRRRKLLKLEIQDEEQQSTPPLRKKSTTIVSKNQTKTIKPSSTKSSNNTTTNSTVSKTTLKKLNSTSSKPLNATKLNKSLDLSTSKSSTPKNKTQTLQKPKPQLSSTTLEPKKTEKKIQPQSISEKKAKEVAKTQNPIKPNWLEFEDEDFVSEFRDLPSRFQKTLLPDLERISVTSRAYINQANKEISEGFRPLVGKQYAPTIASVISCIFIFVPLLLVSLIFNRIKAYFSLQKILIFIQVYLSIYFAILCFASLATGLEPLRFFYVTSQSSYICLQVLQTLAYVLYLLLLLMYMILVYSTDTGFGLKVLALAQTFVGFAVGLHYYVSVFHRAVLHQAPKTNWKVHGIYSTCFLVICLLANAERRKKAYLEEGGEEGKKN